MELMIVTRPFRSGDELLKAGDKMTVEDGQVVIERGYARRLSGSDKFREAETLLIQRRQAA